MTQNTQIFHEINFMSCYCTACSLCWYQQCSWDTQTQTFSADKCTGVDWWNTMRLNRFNTITWWAIVSLHYVSSKRDREILSFWGKDKNLYEPADNISRRKCDVLCSRNMGQAKSRTYLFAVYEQWENNCESCQRDLLHLVRVLWMAWLYAEYSRSHSVE
jgi:hypothetical protein